MQLGLLVAMLARKTSRCNDGEPKVAAAADCCYHSKGQLGVTSELL